MIRYVTGDATRPFVEYTFPVILHVVNNLGFWGAGFTRALDREHPLAGQSYKRWCEWSADRPQLGDVLAQRLTRDVTIVHLMAQRGVGSGLRVDYAILEETLAKAPKAACDAEAPSPLSFHMPRIGCGLGGGTWDQVEPLIQRTLVAAGYAVTVYDL